MKVRFSNGEMQIFDFTPETIGAVSQDDVLTVVQEQIAQVPIPGSEALKAAIVQAILTDLTTEGTALNMALQDIVGRAFKSIDSLTRIALGSDATGDMYYRAANGGLVRIPLGNANQVLGVYVPGGANPNVPAWTTPAIINWTELTANGVAAVNTGYVLTLSTGLTLTLPATAPVGSQVLVIGKSGNWVVKANTGQTINFLGTISAAGGTATAQAANQFIQLIATTADTVWTVATASGEVDIV